MKILLFLLTPFLFFAQQTTEKKDELFVALYTIGDSWDASKAPNEQKYFEEHSIYLKQLRSYKTIVIGARYSETGMIILKAPDIETAKNLVNSDTAVHNQLFNVEVHPFSPFYKGCLE